MTEAAAGVAQIKALTFDVSGAVDLAAQLGVSRPTFNGLAATQTGFKRWWDSTGPWGPHLGERDPERLTDERFQERRVLPDSRTASWRPQKTPRRQRLGAEIRRPVLEVGPDVGVVACRVLAPIDAAAPNCPARMPRFHAASRMTLHRGTELWRGARNRDIAAAVAPGPASAVPPEAVPRVTQPQLRRQTQWLKGEDHGWQDDRTSVL
jgi:hypothetical protein